MALHQITGVVAFDAAGSIMVAVVSLSAPDEPSLRRDKL